MQSVLKTRGAKVALSMGMVAALSSTVAFAAIPVIDWDNIAQQIKTYEETVKVVQTQIETVTTLKNELVGRPTSWFNEQKNMFKKDVNDLKKLQSDVKGLLNTGKTTLAGVEKDWNKTFASISELPDKDKTGHQVTLARQATDANMSKSHKEGIAALNVLTNKLTKLNEDIAKEIERLPSYKDQKSIQQAEAIIASKQAQITGIQGQIQSINAKTSIMRNEREIRDRQNRDAAHEETVKRNKAYANSLNTEKAKTLPKVLQKGD